ncbi:uncharacterized protein LOC124169570 [Ischnura elegans]|uniref:uncharacterized protein LOC124169570 n=1 Tax=Ischnura elegans TaxID=197161 RepID=UPI001ED88A08|nr:uncharacterized protein LOC124169570 [Ischnura elegans]
MATGTLTGIHKLTNPPRPGEPMPPCSEMNFDDKEEKLLAAEDVEEDLSDALCSELTEAEGDGANSAKGERVQDPPVIQTPVIASETSPGDKNRLPMPDEKDREGHDNRSGNTNVSPNAEGDGANFAKRERAHDHPEILAKGKAHKNGNLTGDVANDGTYYGNYQDHPSENVKKDIHCRQPVIVHKPVIVTQTPVVASESSPGDKNRLPMPDEKEREEHDNRSGNTNVRPDAEDVKKDIHCRQPVIVHKPVIVTQTPVVASESSPGDKNRLPMPDEKEREEHDNRSGNTNVRPDAEGAFMNENYVPSQSRRAFQDTYEPSEQMIFCTHGLDAKNSRFKAENDFRHPCQHGPTEEREQRKGAMPGVRFATDQPPPRRPPGNLGISEMPLEYLLELVDRAWRGEAIEEVELLLESVYEDMREEPENEWLWEQPDPLIIRGALLHRLTETIIHEMGRQEHEELHPQQTTPSRQYFGQTSPGYKCSCHSYYQMHSSQNTTRKDYGNAWEGEERTNHSRTHCRKHNIPSMEETNHSQRRTEHLEGKVAAETQPRGRQRRDSADMAAYLQKYEEMDRDLKILEKKRISMITAYNEGLQIISNPNIPLQSVWLPLRSELDDITREINMLKLELSQLDQYYGIDVKKDIHCRQPVRQY